MAYNDYPTWKYVYPNGYTTYTRPDSYIPWNGGYSSHYRKRRRPPGGGGGGGGNTTPPSSPFWNDTKIQQAIFEAKNYGRDFVISKYGQSKYDLIKDQIDKSFHPAKPLMEGSYNREGFGSGGKLFEGIEAPKSTAATAFQPGTFKPKMRLNLENDSDRPQGSQHDWAQPTSISSTITGLLRQAQNASPDYWSQYFSDKGGQYALDSTGASDLGVTPRWTPEQPTASALAASNPFGAFGTNWVMNPDMQQALAAGYHSWDQQGPGQQAPQGPGQQAPQGPQGPQADPNLPPYYTPDDPLLPPVRTMPTAANPWAFGAGGDMNAYGPSNQTMAQSTMEALSLANAYFAPQRMELAYELGDMETDMRRLAANLGRQVDDPVLQAKLYKEATRAVRTLDVQQNTFAFQMAEQRRREELQNFQFYDQLAQEEYKTYLQNRLNERQLDLAGRYYGLQRGQVINDIKNGPSSTTTTNTTPPATPPNTNPPQSALRPQSQFALSQPAYQGAASLSGIYGNLLKSTPYSRTMGAGNIVRSTWPG